LVCTGIKLLHDFQLGHEPNSGQGPRSRRRNAAAIRGSGGSATSKQAPSVLKGALLATSFAQWKSSDFGRLGQVNFLISQSISLRKFPIIRIKTAPLRIKPLYPLFRSLQAIH